MTDEKLPPSLEEIPVGGSCLKCGSTEINLVYANVGFDMWYDCEVCGELDRKDVKLDKESTLNHFMRVVLSEDKGVSADE